MEKNLKIASAQANLSPADKEKVGAISKLVGTHKNLLDMPANEARIKFQSLPTDQQETLKATFGTNPEPQKRGWLGTAWHYSGGQVFNALTEVSDFMTRLYRTGALAKEAGYFKPDFTKTPADKVKILTQAWDKSNDNGELLYNESRISKATAKYGPTRVKLAQQVTQGRDLADIIANGTPEEKEIASLAAQNNDPLWQDAYDAANYSIIKIAGSTKKVDEAFNNPGVVNFFNVYGKELDNLDKARKAKNVVEAEKASTLLKRIAPEFGPAAVDEFLKAGVKDSLTAKNYFQNSVDMINILKGQAARETPLIPRLTAGRKARIAALTAGNKVLNIDNVGQKLVSALYGTGPQYEDILTGITTRSEDIAALEKQVGRLKGPDGSVRFSANQIQGRIDRFARKFTKVPNPTATVFNVSAPDAVDQIYRTARLTNSRYHSKIIAEAFAAGDEGQRIQITKGLWNTIFSTRGVRKGDPGKTFMEQFAGRGLEKRYAADIVVDGNRVGNPAEFAGEQMALFPYQLSSSMVIPSVVDLDRLTARQGLISRIVGASHHRWVDQITSGWSFLTLAGPRFAIRNAIEDDMFYLARGRNPWDMVKGRLWSTRIRTGKGVAGDETALQKFKDTVFVNSNQGELGAINKFLKADELGEFAAKIAAATNENEVRAVMAEAVLRRKLAYKLDEESAKIVANVAKYGNLDSLLADVSEGAKNAVRGNSRYSNVADDVSRFGKMEAITIDGKAYKRSVGDKAFTQFNPVASEQSKVSWLFQLGVMANDDLGRIAIANLEDETKAVDEMFKYLSNLPKQEKDRFQLYFKGGDERIHAQRAYIVVRNLFSDKKGNINKDLLDKVKKTDKDGYVRVTARDLKLVDLPDDPKLAPEFISGPTLVPVGESDNFVASLYEKGWDAMGEANARWSREPIVINELIRFRKELDKSGFSDKVIREFTANKTDEAYEAAYAAAQRHINAMAEDLAKDSALAFLDNPAVRTQLALTGRNFARFYRATEDFYRRFYRTVRYNPEAITRASLTYDGIAHSGLVQTDDTGEQYFFYPGTTAMYQSVDKVMQAFGQQAAIKAPMPIEFSAKLKMITPSSNPDSLFPTFAGPVSAISMKAIFALVPALEKYERAILGQYAEDQPIVNAIFPAHFNRFFSLMDRNERNSQFASAFRKAASYLEATGHGLKPKIDPETNQEIPITPGELQQYQEKLKASTFTALTLRFLLGFIVPAPPQTTLKSEIADWVRQNGQTNFKQTWNNLVEKTGDYDKAMMEWIRLFPDQVPYTISESESNVVAILSANKKANDWIQKNEGLIKRYPEAASFFIPKEGEFDFDAYKLLINMGLKRSKTMEDYLREVNTAFDENFYYDQQDQYELELANTYNDFEKRKLKEMWSNWSEAFKKARPNLQEELGKGAERAVQRSQALSDLERMLADTSVRLDPAVREPIQGMLTVYNQYVNARDSVYGNGISAENYKDLLKQQAKAELERLSKTNRNAQDAYFALFSRLIRD